MQPNPVTLLLALFALLNLSATPDAAPQWNPYTGSCENVAPLNDPAAAQCDGQCFDLSAPRQIVGPTRPGEAVEIGMWDQSLAPGDGQALARVIAPDGTATTATRAGYGSTWISLHYPADFSGAGSTVPGVYTIVWETRGLVVCDGFTVQPA